MELIYNHHSHQNHNDTSFFTSNWIVYGHNSKPVKLKSNWLDFLNYWQPDVAYNEFAFLFW